MKSPRPDATLASAPNRRAPVDDSDFEDSDFATGGWWWADASLTTDRADGADRADRPEPNADGPAAPPAPAAAIEAELAIADDATAGEGERPAADDDAAGEADAVVAEAGDVLEAEARAVEAETRTVEAEAPTGADPLAEAGAGPAPASTTEPVSAPERALSPPRLPSLGDVLPEPAAEDPIPMLTEVVQVPRYDTEDLPESLAAVDWGDLAERVRENVLERLLRRSDTLLDANLASTLEPALERAMETLTLEMHGALNRMVRDIVGRAVTEELTRLHAEIARHNRNLNPTRSPPS